jgi:N-acetylmuramic acid 6-phosphate etherase
VIGAIHYSKSIGAPTVSITCNPGSEIAALTGIAIAPVTGPEVVTGSTRMKSGTAQKMILNMISTGVMIKLGKVYGNLMVDVKATNEKLVERTKRIVCTATGVDQETATRVLEKTEFSVKPAILMIMGNMECDTARDILNRCGGRLSEAIEHIKKT